MYKKLQENKLFIPFNTTGKISSSFDWDAGDFSVRGPLTFSSCTGMVGLRWCMVTDGVFCRIK